MDGSSIMVGCALTVIPPTYHNFFIDLRENLAKQRLNFDHDFLLLNDLELRIIYYEIQEELSNPALPELRNTDGDEFQLSKLYYTLASTPRQTLDALVTLALIEDADELAQDGTYDEGGELVSIEFPWLKKGNKQHASWDNTVMGHVTINQDQLTIDVNSQKRAEVIKAEIEARLGEQAKFRNAVIQSSKKMLEDIANRSPDAGLGEPTSKEHQETPEVQAQLKKMSEQHWRAWLDTPIPALKDQTPREAALTESGRERLEALLWQFESQNEALGLFTPDFKALREALGVE